MKIRRKCNKKNIIKKWRFFFSIILSFVWLIVFADIGSAEEHRLPTAPPQILSHSPGINAGQFPVNGVISVVWDRPMHPDSTFTVTGPEGFVEGAFLYDPNTFTVTFLPEKNLVPDTRYGVLVAGQVGLNGQVQQDAVQWNFNTVTPTSVSIVTFAAADEGLGQNWWWWSWPSLMAMVSIISLIGFLGIWRRRRSISI